MALVIAALAAAGARAVEDPLQPVTEQVAATAQMAGNDAASPFELKVSGDNLESKVEQTHSPVMVSHPWAVEWRAPNQTMDAAGMVDLGRQVLLDAGSVPDPAVIANPLDRVEALNNEGRSSQADLGHSVMGFFHYDSKNDPRGDIKFNDILDAIGRRFPQTKYILTSVAVHEGTHALDPNIAQEDTEDSELKAFKAQRAYLWALYPKGTNDGEELTTMRQALEWMYKQAPSTVTQVARDVVTTCDMIWGTTDDDSLRKLIQRLYPHGEPEIPSA